MSTLELKFEDLRTLTIESSSIKVRDFKSIYQGLNKIKKAHHQLTKHPRLVLRNSETGEETVESFADWRVRVLTEYMTDLARKDDESDEAYDRRVLAAALQDSKGQITFEFINEVCTILKIDLITEEQWDAVSFEDAREFCLAILQIGEVSDPDGTFLDPRRKA